uniref:TRAF-type domain-containing protein n=1 Tax=Panagrellus redivivus TaxID=6233 RepID=A0A7E4UT46_PANRE
MFVMNQQYIYADDDDEDDEIIDVAFYNLSIDDMALAWGDHVHCSTCIDANCKKDVCQIVKCDNCRVKLHGCKLEEHVAEICPEVFGPCINAIYGCTAQVRRDRKSFHLLTCPANVVVCNLQWNRQIHCKLAKRRMKQVARGHKHFLVEKDDVHLQRIASGELDVWAAMADQNEILSSYCSTRRCRVDQRTSLTPVNPVLPLRFSKTPEQQPSSDSSDAEQFEEERKRRKTKQPFAGCYICRNDPGIQHLHVLGNLSEPTSSTNAPAAPLLDDDSQLALMVPKFYQKRNLFVFLSEARMADSYRKAFQHFWTREMHTFTCQEMFHRSEYESHWKYHNNILQEIDNRIIRRCPGAMNGCDYFVEAMQPASGGRIRFDERTKLFTTEPMPNLPPFSFPESFYGAFKKDHLITLLIPYLDTASLRSLAATNFVMYQLIQRNIGPRKLVSFTWKRGPLKKWEVYEKVYSFSNIPSAEPLIASPEAMCHLRQHMPSCPYFDRIDHSRDASLLRYADPDELKTLFLPQ